jgi:glucokinase
MNDAEFITFGVDVGGTKIAAGLVSFPSGKIIAQRVIPTNLEDGGETALEDIARLGEALRGEALGLPIRATGIGLCELVSPNGEILSANSLGWRKRQVEEKLQLLGPVFIEADVRAAALAESLFGAGQPFSIFLYVTVGTGISCCLMIDCVPYLGARGATGTFASSSITVPCEDCGRSNGRSLEQIASGPALASRYAELTGAALPPKDILAAAAYGQPEAAQVIQSASEALGSALGILVSALDPEAVIVGGGLGLSEGPYWDNFVSSTRRHIWSEIHRDLPVLRAQTGERVGLLGAAAFAWRRLKAES